MPDPVLRRRTRARRTERRLARIRALKARIDELEAQVSALQYNRRSTPDARLSALLSISAALLITHDLEAIISLVVHEAVAIFPGSCGVLLFLYDPASERLVLRASSTGPVPDLKVLPGQGVAGRAFIAPRAMLLLGPEMEHALEDLNDEQTRCVQSLFSFWPPSGALLAPLRIEQQRIGALVLYGGAQAHLLHPRDLQFFQALADLVAVAIVETQQRMQAAALQNDLRQSQSLHAQAQARLNAAQAQLLQSARLAAVGELSASVAHEINNPLYAARNSLYLVEQDLPPDSPHRPFVEIARTELGRITRIITRMRDFYRPARDELGPTDINAMLEETLALVRTHLRHGKVLVETDLAPDLPQPLGNADQLRQVALNLMLNACDAMVDGGTLRVSTRYVPPNNTSGAEVIFQISDTGPGIAPEYKPHLFEPFYTTKPHGTGLGLTISAHIVTQHGGRIEVESEEGAGATFTIRLPLVHDP